MRPRSCLPDQLLDYTRIIPNWFECHPLKKNENNGNNNEVRSSNNNDDKTKYELIYLSLTRYKIDCIPCTSLEFTAGEFAEELNVTLEIMERRLGVFLHQFSAEEHAVEELTPHEGAVLGHPDLVRRVFNPLCKNQCQTEFRQSRYCSIWVIT